MAKCVGEIVAILSVLGDFSKARFHTEGSTKSLKETTYLTLFCPELAKFM